GHGVVLPSLHGAPPFVATLRLSQSGVRHSVDLAVAGPAPLRHQRRLSQSGIALRLAPDLPKESFLLIAVEPGRGINSLLPLGWLSSDATLKPASAVEVEQPISRAPEEPRTTFGPISADYVIVGSGLTGGTIARMLADAGRDVVVLERRAHVGGNVHDHKHSS